MGSFKTILKSIRPFFVDRLARNVHFNTNPIGWFRLNQPKIAHILDNVNCDDNATCKYVTDESASQFCEIQF